MTAAEAVEMSVTNSISQDCTNLDDVPSTRTDSPGFKPFDLSQRYSDRYHYLQNYRDRFVIVIVTVMITV